MGFNLPGGQACYLGAVLSLPVPVRSSSRLSPLSTAMHAAAIPPGHRSHPSSSTHPNLAFGLLCSCVLLLTQPRYSSASKNPDTASFSQVSKRCVKHTSVWRRAKKCLRLVPPPKQLWKKCLQTVAGSSPHGFLYRYSSPATSLFLLRLHKRVKLWQCLRNHRKISEGLLGPHLPPLPPGALRAPAPVAPLPAWPEGLIDTTGSPQGGWIRTDSGTSGCFR